MHEDRASPEVVTMTRTPSFATRALAALLVASTGCSLLGVKPAPSPPYSSQEDVRCTRSLAAPFADLTVGFLGVVSGIAGLAESGRCERGSFCLDLSGIAHGVGAILLGVGLVATSSSVYGFIATSRCREVTDAQIACRGGDEEACGRLFAEKARPARAD
jgi:hypothetical protein